MSCHYFYTFEASIEKFPGIGIYCFKLSSVAY